MIGQPNKFGYYIQAFYDKKDYQLDDFTLAGSFVIAKKDGKKLLCYNSKREQWELPAGKRERGETPSQCAERELKEETGQEVLDLTWIGVMKLVHGESGKVKYNPVFIGDLDVLQPFVENDETNAIMLWDGNDDIGEFDGVDRSLINLMFD